MTLLTQALEALEAMERATQTNDAHVQASASQQCRKAIIALSAVIEAGVVVQQGWRPISEAPKDKVILLGLPLSGNIKEWDRRVYEGRWHKEKSTWTSVNGFLLLGVATHWMPTSSSHR